jgi:hypothetical protein
MMTKGKPMLPILVVLVLLVGHASSNYVNDPAPIKSKPPPLATTKAQPTPPNLNNKPKLNAVKQILEKAVNNWAPKAVPAQSSSTATSNNKGNKTAGPGHSHLDPTHPKSFASKQNKLNEKGWFHYNHKVYSKQKEEQEKEEEKQQHAQHAQQTLPAASDVKKKNVNGHPASIPRNINIKHSGNLKSRGKHHVRHTLPGSVADRGPGGVSTSTRRQNAAIGSLVFIIVAGLAVLCAVGSLFTAP